MSQGTKIRDSADGTMGMSGGRVFSPNIMNSIGSGHQVGNIGINLNQLSPKSNNPFQYGSLNNSAENQHLDRVGEIAEKRADDGYAQA